MTKKNLILVLIIALMLAACATTEGYSGNSPISSSSVLLFKSGHYMV